MTRDDAASVRRDRRGNFLGHAPSECGEHRTVGDHRAWCFADREWCYPRWPCRGCELPMLRAQIDETTR